MKPNSRYSGQKLFFRHIAVPNVHQIDQDRAAAINRSATQTVELIKNLPNKSSNEIFLVLTQKNGDLKTVLNDTPTLKGAMRSSAKRLWVDAVLGKFKIVMPTDFSPCNKFYITRLIPEMGNRIFESFAQVYFESSQDTSLCQELLAADVHIRLKELLVGDAADMVKAYAAGALSNLSRKEAHCQKLLAAGVHTQLGTLLSGNATKKTKEFAAEALSNLSRNEADCQELLAAGVHTQLGALLGDENANPKAKEFAAGAFSNLSRNEADCQELLAAGVHTQLGALLGDENATPEAKEFAAGALSNLSRKEAHCQKLLAAGVHTQLGTLLSGKATEKAKEYAAGALSNLSKNEANCQKLLDARVHTLLVALLSIDAATDQAKEFAAGALMNLSFNAAHRETLVAADVHTRLGALLRGGGTQKATEFAAGAVMNLSFNEANRETLVKDNVHTQLVALLRRGATPKAEEWAALLSDPKATTDEKEKASKALYELSFDDAICQALLAAGVHTQLVTFLKGNCAKDEATELARCTLYNLSSNETRPPLLGADVHTRLGTLLSRGATAKAGEWATLLRDPNATSGDKEGAAEALYSLSFIEASREALLAEGVNTQLEALRLDESATPRAREWAGMALRPLNLLADDVPNLIVAGVREHLRARLSGGITSKATEYAAIALCWLSLNDDNLPALFAAGVHTQLHALLGSDATDTAKAFAAGALENLGPIPL